MVKLPGALLGSKRVQAFARDLVKVGIPKRRSKRLARKLAYLAKPAAFGEVVSKSKGKRIYAIKLKRKNPVYVFKKKRVTGVVILGKGASSWQAKTAGEDSRSTVAYK